MIRKEFPVKGHKGINKIFIYDKESNSYVESKNSLKFRATKSIKGQRTYKCFFTLREATHWKNTYSPPVTTECNNIPLSPLLADIYEIYKEAVFPTLEKSSQEHKKTKALFINHLLNKRVQQITPDLLDVLIRNKKNEALVKNSRRCNFDKELKELRAIFNWYRENYDYKFVSPILKRHFSLGKIKDVPEKNKKMRVEEFLLFIESLKANCDPLFYDFAITQFYTASRVQEIAGLQKECVDFTSKQIEIKYVAVWNRKKQFDYLKSIPKNNEVRYCLLVESIHHSLLRQCNSSSKLCNYVFQRDGKPLKYREIQHNYNKALTKCGLYPKYSSTHIMRHSAAFLTRSITGSLDLTQAMTGHKDQRQVQHYSGSPDNKQKYAVTELEKGINNVILLRKEASSYSQILTEEKEKLDLLKKANG